MIYHIDPRIKTISSLIYIFLLVNLESYIPLLISLGSIIFLLITSRIPAKQVAKKVGLIVPFSGLLLVVLPFLTPGEPTFRFWLLSASREGFLLAGLLGLRIVNTVLVVVFLTSTTNLHALLEGLRTLHFPNVFLQTLEFSIRYIYVVNDEAKNMLKARRSRGFGIQKYFMNRHTLKTLGQLIGLLFLRSFERGERVYLAMLSRGYNGEIRSLTEFKTNALDWIFGASFILFGLFLVTIEKGWF